VAEDLRGEERIHAIAQKWAELLADNWTSLYRWRSTEVAKVAEENNGILTYGLFAEAKKGVIYRQFIAVIFNRAKISPIGTSTLTLSKCWACGQKSDVSLCAMGRVDVATELCTQGKPQWRFPKNRCGFDLQESIAIHIAKVTGLCDLTNTVGGPTDALELTSTGNLKWLINPKHCP